MIRMLFVFLVVGLSSIVYPVLAVVTCPLNLFVGAFDFLFYLWAKSWLWAAGVRLKIENEHFLPGPGDPPYIVMSNHRSILD